MQWRTIGTFLVAGSLLFLGSGCSEGERLSGEEIVHGRVGDLTEEARIDGHAQGLVPIQGLLVVRDGMVVVGQPQAFEVRFYDDNGERIGSFGRRGDGPGELRGVRTMGWRGDTLWVFDPAQQRISFISGSGELIGSESIPQDLQAADPVRDAPVMARAIPVGIGAGDVRYVSFSFRVGIDQPPPFDASSVISRMSSQGTLDRIVAEVPHGQVMVTTSRGAVFVPFPNRGFMAASSTADRFAAAFAPLEGANAGTITITTWDSDGIERWSRTYPVHLQAIPETVADSAVAARIEGLPPELLAAFQEQYRVPQYYPPVEGLVFGNDDTLWIATVPSNGLRPHLVLDRSGDLIGTVMVPRDGRVGAADRERVWVIEQDEFDVESVVRYSLRWD